MSRLLTAEEAKNFSRIISNYQPNNAVLSQFKDSNFAVIAGPAGAGKDTLRNSLIKLFPNQYINILSTTTRPPRAGEKDGEDYYFKEISDVKNNLIQQQYFQTALVHSQQVSCLHIDEIKKLGQNQTGLSIMIPSAQQELRQTKADIRSIFLIPPSLKILKQRILSERMHNQAEINRRLGSAAPEIDQALKSGSYYCIISDTVEKTVTKAHDFLQNKSAKIPPDEDARAVMRQILLELA